MSSSELGELVDTRSIVVCCGTGGVGKTTIAATLALEGARRGRRTVVVTIDPARRLADALGLSGLSNTATRIDGDWPGELWGVMLDTRTTFDDLIARYSPDEGQRDRILGNRFYRNIAGTLSGTQEYMAAEKLFELHDDERFDLVVVDTPPTRRALDFLDAPTRLTRFLDHRLYRALMVPTRVYLKAVNFAAQAFLRTVSKVVGGEVIADAISFFQAFDGMEAGFRDRAGRVLELLTAGQTAYVLVATPRSDTVAEATFFADKLAADGLTISALVVNRMHPVFGDGTVEEAMAEAAAHAATPLGSLWANLAEMRQLAAREAEHVSTLAARIEPAPIVRVVLRARDIHDLDGLDELGAAMFDRRPSPSSPRRRPAR